MTLRSSTTLCKIQMTRSLMPTERGMTTSTVTEILVALLILESITRRMRVPQLRSRTGQRIRSEMDLESSTATVERNSKTQTPYDMRTLYLRYRKRATDLGRQLDTASNSSSEADGYDSKVT